MQCKEIKVPLAGNLPTGFSRINPTRETYYWYPLMQKLPDHRFSAHYHAVTQEHFPYASIGGGSAA
jgi:hypothetical protein